MKIQSRVKSWPKPPPSTAPQSVQDAVARALSLPGVKGFLAEHSRKEKLPRYKCNNIKCRFYQFEFDEETRHVCVTKED